MVRVENIKPIKDRKPQVRKISKGAVFDMILEGKIRQQRR